MGPSVLFVPHAVHVLRRVRGKVKVRRSSDTIDGERNTEEDLK